jgi:uncharacterized protein YbjT (DUF2867 family)
MNSSLILVIGATGGTGRLVAYELEQRRIPARYLVRDRQRAQTLLGDREFWCGDALTADFSSAFVGISAVISTLGSREPNGLRSVDLPATQRLIQMACQAQVAHFVLCSTIGAVPTPGVPDHLTQAFAPKGEAEAALRQSGLPYTIIRPGRLFDEVTSDPRGISRRQVAQALVESLSQPEALNSIYELNQARLALPGAHPLLGLKV